MNTWGKNQKRKKPGSTAMKKKEPGGGLLPSGREKNVLDIIPTYEGERENVWGGTSVAESCMVFDS